METSSSPPPLYYSQSGNTVIVGYDHERGLDNLRHPGTVFVDLSTLSPETLAALNPTLIMSLVFGSGYDAVDVAKKLQFCGFGGRYRACSDTVPRPEMVRYEIGDLAPGVDFAVVSMPGQQSLH